MKIYLDDERPTPEGWIGFNTAEKLINFIDLYDFNHGNDYVPIEIISLDHDLGVGKSGYDFLVWLEEKVYNNVSFSIPSLVIHSANPVGKQNMMRVIESIKRIKQAQIQE